MLIRVGKGPSLDARADPVGFLVYDAAAHLAGFAEALEQRDGVVVLAGAGEAEGEVLGYGAGAFGAVERGLEVHDGFVVAAFEHEAVAGGEGRGGRTGVCQAGSGHADKRVEEYRRHRVRAQRAW